MPQEVANKRYEKNGHGATNRTARQTIGKKEPSEKKRHHHPRTAEPRATTKGKKKINTYTFRLPSFSFCSLLK